MRNLIQRFRKKEKDRSILKINITKYEGSKNINDVLRPIYILSIIFGLRVFGYPRSQSRTTLSFLYSILLYCIHNISWYYTDRQLYSTKVFDLNGLITHFTYIINLMVIFIIPTLGLYHSQVSPRNMCDILILTIFQWNFDQCFRKWTIHRRRNYMQKG